jgi:probable rRNA maturation factor
MIKINVLIVNNNWKKNIKNPNLYLKRKVKKIEEQISFFRKRNYLTASILLAGDKEIKDLNKKFRKKNKTTDVLSFPFYERETLNKLIKKSSDIYLGDIIINFSKIIRKKDNSNFLLDFDRIWVHGLAHLLGHRHKSNRDYSVMKKIENKILKAIN